MNPVAFQTRLPAGVLAALAALAVALSLAMRFSTPATVSWGIWVALLAGFLLVPMIPTLVYVSMAARPRPGDVYLVLPSAVLPLAYAAMPLLPESVNPILNLTAVLLVLVAPVVAAVRRVEGTVYLSLLFSGLFAIALAFTVITRDPGWARDDGLGQGFFIFFTWVLVGIYVADVAVCAAIGALLKRLPRRRAGA